MSYMLQELYKYLLNKDEIKFKFASFTLCAG